jgi:DNA helicase IV
LKETVAPQTLSYEERKARDKEVRKLKNSISKLEVKIQDLETAIAEIQEKLSNLGPDQRSDMTDLAFKHEALESDLQQNLDDWEKTNQRLDELSSNES